MRRRRRLIAEPLARLFEEFANTFHGVDLFHQRRENRRLIAATGADLEHLLARESGQQRFCHASDDKRLADRLPEADWQRRILVSTTSQRLVYKQMSRYVADLVQHHL